MKRIVRRWLLTLWFGSLLAVAGVIALAPLLSPAEVAVFVASIQGRRQLMLADLAWGISAALPPHDRDVFQPSATGSGELLFAAYREGDSELYRLRLGEGAPEQLTDNAFDNLHPQWSPAGGLIAYQANPSGAFHIFILDVANGETRQLTSGAGGFANPHWSPAGDRLAFDAAGEIYIAALNSGRRRALTADEHWDAHPVWSPAGDSIVYESFQDGSWNLKRIDLASGEISALTPPGRDEQHASFTQRGQLVYQSVTRFVGELFLLNIEKPAQQRARAVPPGYGAPLQLLFGNGAALKPRWSDILEPEWLR